MYFLWYDSYYTVFTLNNSYTKNLRLSTVEGIKMQDCVTHLKIVLVSGLQKTKTDRRVIDWL